MLRPTIIIITTVEAGLFCGLRVEIQFEGESSRVGGAGKGRFSCDHSKAASPEAFEGTSATGIEVSPLLGFPEEGAQPDFYILPHPFSTQGVWTIAPLQKRFALPKRQAHSGPVEVGKAGSSRASEGPSSHARGRLPGGARSRSKTAAVSQTRAGHSRTQQGRAWSAPGATAQVRG